MNIEHGLNLVGLVLGTRPQTKLNQQTGESKTHFELGVKVLLPDGFGGIKEEIKIIRLGKKAVEGGIAHFQQYEQKTCCIPVFLQPWSNGNGFTTYLGTGQITVLPDAAKKAA